MLFDRFKDICKRKWDEYFIVIKNSRQNITSTGTPLYPTHILFMNFGDHYGMELLGASHKPVKLRQKIAKYKDAQSYFDLFNQKNHNPYLKLTASGTRFTQLNLAHDCDFTVAKSRFSYINLYPSVLLFANGHGSVVEFCEGFKDVIFERCVLVNHSEGLFRAKNILFLAVFAKQVSSQELKLFFSELLEEGVPGKAVNIHGIFTAGTNEKTILVASQLQNLYLSTGIHETTIGDFLVTHPQILKQVFKTDHFVYEPTLQWLEHDSTVKDTAINPDLFIRRDDGNYDIIDLKLARLDRKNLTKGKRSRRRFVDYVCEGVAQLANYKFYFSFEKNCEFAFEKYQIKIENPNLALVVGSMENIEHKEIIEALRSHEGLNINVIDYDTLVSTFLLNGIS